MLCSVALRLHKHTIWLRIVCKMLQLILIVLLACVSTLKELNVTALQHVNTVTVSHAIQHFVHAQHTGCA